MRYSQRNLVLAFGSFSLLMLLIYWILGEMLFKENVRNTVPVSSRKKMTDIHNFTLLEDGLWQSFKRHYLISSVISQRNNNQSTLTGVACASEVYLTTCGNPGMAALILMSLDHISVCLEIGGMPTVFWRNCYTVCPSNASINAWELYFEPVNPNIEKQLDKVYCLGSYTTPEIAYQSRFNRRNNTKDTKSKGLLPLSFHRRDIEGFDGIITRNVRLFANSLINRYIRVLPKIEMVVNDFFSKHMDKYNLLAVHIRGTDHGDETMDGKLPSLITWIKNAKYQLDSLPSPKRIFVASDNIESINKFVAEFGDKVIYTSAYRAKHYSHGESVHTSNYDPYKLGSEVLIDILLMAKCKHFLHAESSVAALVTYFNPNMHSHFLDYYIVQEANKNADKKSHGKSNTDDEDNNFDEHKNIDPSEIMEAFECFQENSPFSACKDMAKGKFLDISGG